MIKINTATMDELMTLKGVGEKLAQRILLVRGQYGSFKDMEDLISQVKGLGNVFARNNVDNISFELPLEEQMQNKRDELYEQYIAPLAGAFIKGEATGNRAATRQAMDRIKACFLSDTTLGEEGWALVVEWATQEFKAHKEESVVTLYDDNMMPLDNDEELVNDARRMAKLWSMTKESGGGQLDEQSQEYVDTLEELLYLQHKLDTETVGRSPEENDCLLKLLEQLELQLAGLEMAIKDRYEADTGSQGNLARLLKLDPATAYVRRLRDYTELAVERELQEDSMEYLFSEQYGGLDAEGPDPLVEAQVEAFISVSELRRLREEVECGEYEPRFEENWGHIYYMKEKAEGHMEDILARRQREQEIAVHGRELVDGQMKQFIFPETNELLSRYRAKVKAVAQNTDDETEYYMKLAEMRKTMLKSFQSSQRTGQNNYRAQFIDRLKKELHHLRTLFFMPYDRTALRKAQQAHVQQNKPLRFLPTKCKKDLQLNLMVRRDEYGKQIEHEGMDLLAFLNKEKLITLYNDGVSRLLAMGVSENELPNFHGTVFLRTYEEHMKAQGKVSEANAYIKARKERDEKLEAMKFYKDFNRAVGMFSYMDEEGELVEMEILDESMGTPEEYVQILEVLQGDEL